MAYVSNQCFSYKRLKKQIGKQCDIYKELSETGALGSISGMYHQTADGRSIPGEKTAAFLRGGVILTMACFEEFLNNLTDEVRANMEYEIKDETHFGGECPDCLDNLDYEHIFEGYKEPEKEINIRPGLHDWPKELTKKIPDLVKRLCSEDCPIKYYYLLDEKTVSYVEIKDSRVICLLLRLFYGIRCIMAHGNSQYTLKCGALKGYPICTICTSRNSTCTSGGLPDNALDNKLKDIGELSKKHDECIKRLGKPRVLKKDRKSPNKELMEKLDELESNTEASGLMKKFDDETKTRSILTSVKTIICKTNPTATANIKIKDENYAFFHLCRIHHWLEDGREAYITYNMLVRINQFILLLAHRMRFAVAKHMMDENKRKSTRTDRIWNVPKDNTAYENKIKKFEDKHEEKAMELSVTTWK